MLNTTGANFERFVDSFAKLQSDIQLRFDSVVDFSDDSLINTMSGIFSYKESELWELLQAVYDSANLLSAEGTLLDNLALLVGVTRYPQRKTRGALWVSLSGGTILPAGTRFQSITGDYFLSENAVSISTTNCIEAKMYVKYLTGSERYTLNINGNIFTKEPDRFVTERDILEHFENALKVDGSLTTSISSDTQGEYLLISRGTSGTPLYVSATSYLGFRSVLTPVIVSAEEFGAIYAEPNTITTLVNTGAAASIDETIVYNPYSLVTGALKESDEKLRRRISRAYRQVTGGSFKSIKQALQGVAGVTHVKVLENMTDAVDSNGLPPKSFKAIVNNGDSKIISEKLWEYKPAGIQCYAPLRSPLTENVTILDYNQQSHNVRFVRPTTKYIWVACEYTLYNEEEFPTSGEAIIKEGLANYGKTLGIGQDVIPDRFLPHIYRNVKGVEDIELYFAVTYDLNTTPVYPDDYAQGLIDVTDEEVTNFSSARVIAVKI